MDCVYCEDADIKTRIIAENATALAFPTNIPITPGHILIIPKRHVKYYEELTIEEKNGIEDLRMKLKHALIKAFGAEGFHFAWNEEKIGGQSIPHFHLHIVPRKQGDTGIYEYEPRKFLYRPEKERPVSPDEELQKVVKEIKNIL